MSYNPDPVWTDKITLPHKNIMICPTCGVIAFNVDEVMAPLYEATYYEPRHIPPRLVFTCGNPDCPDCDKDFYVELFVEVTTKLSQRDNTDE